MFDLLRGLFPPELWTNLASVGVGMIMLGGLAFLLLLLAAANYRPRKRLPR